MVGLTPAEVLQELVFRNARASFLGWCGYALAADGLAPARHHRVLIDRLERVCSGEIRRLMVQMPPGSAKSTYSSVFFAPYFMMRHPKAQVIGGSSNLGLAMDFSAKAQGLIREHEAVLGYGLANDNKELWYTSLGGRYKATGVGSNVAGSRSDLTLIDDPFGGREDADSSARRKQVYDWFRGDVIGRQKPGGRIILIMTRWHEDDLAGRLSQDQPAGWHVLKLPAVCEEEGDPMGRLPGELLWPEWFDAAAVAQQRFEAGEREWASQYQQRPGPSGGALFPVERIGVAAVDAPGRKYRAWDLAATEKIGSRDPDYTAGVRLGLDGNVVVVEDVVRERGTPATIERLILRTAEADGRGVTICLPQDPGQAAKTQISYLVAKLGGYTVQVMRPSGNKATRAMPVASQADAGNLALRPGAWNRAFKDELEVFPNGSHDDQVDALSDAYAALLGKRPGAPARWDNLRIMER